MKTVELEKQVAELQRELAANKIHSAQALESYEALRVKARELSRAYDEIDHRGAGQEETLIDYIRRVSSSVQIHKDRIAAQERSQAELREDVERLDAELHHAHRLLVRRKTEVDDLKARLSDAISKAEEWKDKVEAQGEARWRAECDRDELQDRLDAARSSNVRAYQAGKREAFEHLGRRIVRRAISRVMEVVR